MLSLSSWFRTAILSASLLSGAASFAVDQSGIQAADDLEVIGVIAADGDGGIALIKYAHSDHSSAVKVGAEVEPGVKLMRVSRDYIYLRSHGKDTPVRVGESYAARSAYETPGLDTAGTNGGIEKVGKEVRMTSVYRDQVKREIGKVLMQAAAVPYYSNGALAGFRLWEIDAGSLYDRAGFKNGDIVTAINGQKLSDVAVTIRLLQSMREEPRADFTFERQGVEQSMTLVVN